MSGGGGMASSGGAAARVRIKGRKGSVVRFLIISIAYTLPWIIMLSQLAYYSKVYGPQVLLQLNIAYYLPSIPVLLLFGQVEKLLDAEFGHTGSMAVRLMAGLAACAALAAYYPFMPTHLAYLLGLVVVLGAVSSVAFSTSYQLVAWFRSADTIALGIGCVASGPLALVIQIALQIGTKPKHWQWIALFEISAAVVVVGMAAALSLLWQYWGILSGTEAYDDGSSRQPLLDSEVQAERLEEEASEQALMLSRVLTLQDPFQGFPFTTTPGMVMPHPSIGLRRAASDDITDRRRHARSDRAAAAAEAGAAGLKPSAAASAAAAAAAAAAATAGRHLKHSQTYAPGRASAPLHAAPHSSLYDGGLIPAAAAAAASPSAAAAGLDAVAAAAGSSSSARSGSILAAAAAAGAAPTPAAAAVAASARAVSLQHYSGLPMVPPPPGPSSSTSVGAAAAGAAWLPDVEQQLMMPGGAGGGGGTGGSSSVGTRDTPLDTPKDPFFLGSSITSGSARSSRAGSPGPYTRTAAGAAGTGAAAGVAGVQQGYCQGQGVPAPALSAGSYACELPHFPLHTQQQQQQGQQQGQQHVQQPLLSSVLGGSAPVLPLAASLFDEDSRGPSPSDSSSEEGGVGGEEHVAAAAAGGGGGGGGVGGQGRCVGGGMTSHPEAGGVESPHHVSTALLHQALQHHVTIQQQQQGGGGGDGSRPTSSSDLVALQQQQQPAAAAVPSAAAAAALRKAGGHHQRTGSTASVGAASVVTVATTAGGGEHGEAPEGLAEVFVEVLQGTWMVVLAALISSTMLNCIFPFFTYVESSGLLGEFLPQVLFYTRMLSDILGRLLPRRKALAITAPAALLALAGALLVGSSAFFVYLQVPPRMQHDPYVLVLIFLLWLTGGYINTMSYILAPSLVAPRVCTKASALMALTYQVAHILGLVLATGLALALYGDIAGEL